MRFLGQALRNADYVPNQVRLQAVGMETDVVELCRTSALAETDCFALSRLLKYQVRNYIEKSEGNNDNLRMYVQTIIRWVREEQSLKKQ